ncbi:KpsF/GutQ family sugar-phosphate isomerase [Leptospira sp. GIMC2001]|uniref:KpsF/GutQ family sugar-phosphate isomerase n=1 Tax=Leptospira sp. GIMC2001 TaxID=1513297 RepID=UPI00234A560B|nr:KpsF/GutQ family sugar-phosphate isomerase [Leptospira sp. GIMC2001]WCL49404.1 KpsF/GutQ family sugar-phosphate isomerase [Leptospira sp. GIMC2001]
MSQEIISKIEKALDIEIESILHFRKNLDSRFADAVNVILQSKGKVILTGVGKSGDIAKKVSSTLSSTGTPAIFIHPTDALHGDAGIIARDDVVIAIGKSGESEELNSLIPTAKSIGAKIISITANDKSSLAKQSDVILLTPILKEACPLALAPTSSTTIALMAGDALAMTLMELRNFQAEDFALYHPAGRLGKRLALKIDDVMRKGTELAQVKPEDNLDTILKEITSKLSGCAAVTDHDGILIGFITDYDIRKKVLSEKIENPTAEKIMTANPAHFPSGSKAYEVLVSMESRERPISAAPIADSNRKLVGIVTVHDLLQKGL